MSAQLAGQILPSKLLSPRNLRIAYFSQHHVDQLVMDVSALELIQSRFPGMFSVFVA